MTGRPGRSTAPAGRLGQSRSRHQGPPSGLHRMRTDFSTSRAVLVAACRRGGLGGGWL